MSAVSASDESQKTYCVRRSLSWAPSLLACSPLDKLGTHIPHFILSLYIIIFIFLSLLAQTLGRWYRQIKRERSRCTFLTKCDIYDLFHYFKTRVIKYKDLQYVYMAESLDAHFIILNN